MSGTRLARKLSEAERAALDAQREQRRAEAAVRLEAFCSTDDVLAWVRTRRYMHTFSLTNQILLVMQLLEREVELGDAGIIQAAWRWKKAGYHPAKGSASLRVWGPHSSKKDADGTWRCPCGLVSSGARCAAGHERRKVFVLKPVFAACDVRSYEDGSPPPPPPSPAPLEGDSHAHLLLDLTLGVLADPEVPVTAIKLEELPDDHGGYYAPTTHKIGLNKSWSPNARVATLIHELAHAIGDVNYENYTRSQAEVIAEAAAALACADLGLDTQIQAAPYIASWGGREGEPPADALRRHLTFVDELARRIVALVPQDEEADDA